MGYPSQSIFVSFHPHVIQVPYVKDDDNHDDDDDDNIYKKKDKHDLVEKFFYCALNDKYIDRCATGTRKQQDKKKIKRRGIERER